MGPRSTAEKPLWTRMRFACGHDARVSVPVGEHVAGAWRVAEERKASETLCSRCADEVIAHEVEVARALAPLARAELTARLYAAIEDGYLCSTEFGDCIFCGAHYRSYQVPVLHAADCPANLVARLRALEHKE